MCGSKNKAISMNPGCGYTAEVTNLSPTATEKDIHDFFALCGKIDHIEIVRAGEVASTAYVTFASSHAVEIAVLLNGATIVDQAVCIARWGHHEDEYDYWKQFNFPEATDDDDSIEHTYVPSAEDVVKTKLSKGKDAHGLTGKVGERMGLIASNFLKGAVWVSDALRDAAEAAVDLGSQGINK